MKNDKKELKDEELEKVSGGYDHIAFSALPSVCPDCGHKVEARWLPSMHTSEGGYRPILLSCTNCDWRNTYFVTY